MLYENFGRLARTHRLIAEQRQADVAKKCGRSAVWLSQIETGARSPTRRDVENIADALGIDPMLLLSMNKRRK